MCARNASPFLTETWKVEGWTDGWTVAEPYAVTQGSFVLMLKTAGYAGDGNNVHIHDVHADGTLGVKRHVHRWTQGWTIAQFFVAPEGPRLLLIKTMGFDGSGANVHVREVRPDGSIADEPLFRDTWSQGWTTARIYGDGQASYLFLLKSAGYGSDSNNVHIHPVLPSGAPGPQRFGKRWTQGWSHARFYREQQRTFLVLLKTSGVASDGHNLHVNEVLAGGDIQPAVADRRSIGEGWTSACTCTARGRTYLVVTNRATGAVHVHALRDGRIAGMVNAYDRDAAYTDEYDTGSLSPDGPTRWTRGWTDMESLTIGGHTYLFALKTTLTGNQEKRAKLLRVNPMDSVGPIVLAAGGQRFTIAMTLASDGAAYQAIVNGAAHAMTRPAGDYYAIAQAQVPATAGAAVDYRVTRDGATVAQGSFRAARPPQTAPFTIAVAACADLSAGRDQPAWAALAARQPQLILLVGDNAYPNTSMRSMVWAEYLQQRGVDTYAAALRQVPVLATWDDHDFGPNNSGGEDVDREFRDESARAFRELHPGLPYAASDGIYYRVGWQDVDVFMLDVRYFRHWYKTRTGFTSSRHMLGTQQWQWLERELAASQAAFKLVVSGTTLDSGGTETWAEDYTTEWMRLRALALATPGMVVVSGDIHRCMVQRHRLDPTRWLYEIVSSGIGTGSSEQGFATITVDATVPDPTLTAQLFRKNGDERVDERVLIRRSRVS